jgi:8-amino-7-oxononanoate synthase
MNPQNRQPNPSPAPASHRIPSGGGGVVGIWYRDGHVLMTRRASGIPYPNLWCFPGGGIEAGEDEIAALKREWREELGTAVQPLRKIGSFEITNAAGRFPLHWYFVTSDDDAFRPNPLEVAEVRWIPVEQLPHMPDLIASNRTMLASLGLDVRAACEALCLEDRENHLPSPNDMPAAQVADLPYESDAMPGAPSLARGDGHAGSKSGSVSSAPAWHHDLRRDLDDLRARNMHRRLRTVASPIGRTLRLDSGRDVLNFASNDYLGLANDPRLAAAAGEAADRFGWGAGGSRLICGHTSVHAELERALAAFKRTEAALVLPTGYMANLAAIRTLAGPGDVLLLDKLNHASIIDAASASGAEVRIFPHRKYDKLERLLQRYSKARRRLIVTDTIFSMDGDVADLPCLVALKRQYDAILIVDEAHATGVLGPTGRGLAELQEVEADIDVTVGTLSKALGGIGGFIVGPAVLVEALVNFARPFIFTTGLPAAACAAAIQALQLVDAEPWRRQKVLDLAARLRAALSAAGWDTAGSQTQIIPAIVGSADRAVQLANHLLESGILAPAVRPPAVPPDGSRLRISVTAAHEPADVDAVAAPLKATSSHM